jgi:methyl-accepting chemotaxis protein
LSHDVADEGSELAVRVPDIERAYPLDTGTELTAQHARLLSQTCSRTNDEDRTARVASVARDHAAAGLSPSTYVGSFVPLFEELVVETLADTATDTEELQAELLAGIRSAMVDMLIGVDEFADDDVEPLGPDQYREELTLEEVFDSIPHPSYLIDDDNTMLAYNIGQDRLLGLEDNHREFLGGGCRDTLAAATYTDGSRHYTLADKVAENPRDADKEWDIERVDQDNEYTDHFVYQDSSVSTNTDGEETYIEFVAVPIFDDDGSLKAVFELTQDRTEEVSYQRSVSALVDEVSETLAAIGNGDLSARVEFEDEYGVLEEELLEVTGEIDEMAESFQSLVSRVSEKTTDLHASIDRATTSARDIDGMVDSQRESLEQVADEMEEVAATSNEVAEAAETALSEAERGAEAGQDARTAVDEVRTVSDDLVEIFNKLDECMDEVGEFADVIADVADQTNILALNANIEAARAGDDGSGFAVVADEVKQLATETQDHAEEITNRIGTVQGQADETVAEVERSHDRIQEAGAEIGAAVDALEAITESVEDAADGILEVANANANDEQAVTVEEVTAAVDGVRDEAANVAEITKDVFQEAETQERAVRELAERVHELSTETALE